MFILKGYKYISIDEISLFYKSLQNVLEKIIKLGYFKKENQKI